MLGSAFDPYGLTPEAVLADGFEADQAEAELRLATAAYHSDPIDLPANTVWPPRILSAVEIEQSIISLLGVGGVVALTSSALLVHDGDGWATDLARYGTADGRQVEIRAAQMRAARASDYGTPLRDTDVVWRGTVARVDRLGGRRARVLLADAAERLGVPLQSLRYAGSGGLQGGEGLTDRPLPVCLGRCFNILPVEVGLVDLGDGLLPTYQVHWRAIAGIDALRIRGVDQSATGGAPGVGQYRPWLALGLAQLGSTPDGPVTCDVRGEAEGYPSTIASVLWSLLSLHGPQLLDTDRDASSWAFADADLPGEIGLYQGAEPVTTLEAVQRVLAGCGAVLAGDRADRLRLVDPFTASATLQFDIPADYLLADPEPVALPDAIVPAPREVQVEWGRNGAPLADIGTAADPALRARLADGAAPAGVHVSELITQRIARQRTLRLPGLYWALADAQARAERISAWLEGGARAFRIVIDRYLGQINIGDVGRLTYPGYGLESGLVGVVIGWREMVDARRLEIVIVGSGG